MKNQRTGILAAGNWIIDHVKIIDQYPVQESLAIIQSESLGNGGGPYNLLKDLAKMGAPFSLEGIGLLGDDAEGRWILEDCRAHGIDISRMQITTEAPTSYTDVMTVRSTGKRTFFHQPGANACLSRGHFQLKNSNARIFYLAYLLLLDALETIGPEGQPETALLLQEARALGFKTAVDVVSENSDRFDTLVKPVLPRVDYFILNEYEAEKLSQVPTRNRGEVRLTGILEAARKIVAQGVREWVVIHFPEGALAISPKGESFVQGSVRVPPKKIKGTAGAGDAFAAGFLLGMHESWNIKESLQLGVCAAAVSLFHPTCSEGVQPLQKCLGLGQMFGFHSLDLKVAQ